MQTRSVILLVLGLVIALLTAWSLKHRMSETNQTVINATQVLIASSDIKAGEFVRASTHLAFANWPKENITDAMLTNQQVKLTDFEGAVARRDVTKGEAIQKTLFVKSNEGGFMSAVLDAGKRAVSVAVDSTTGNAGFIFPGDHVDLILTHSVKTRENDVRASETFIEDVRVLAIDQMLTNPENKAVLAKTITLEVSPKQAEEINVAKDLGKISVSLRSLAHTPVVETVSDTPPEVSTLDDVLRSLDEPKPVTAAPTNVTRDTDVSHVIMPNGGANMRVRVIRGNKQEDIMFGPASTTATEGESPDAR